MVILFGILPFISTSLGGLAVFRFRHRLHPIMGFAAGVVVTTALVDLLPEAAELVGDNHRVLVGGLAVAGYLTFSALEAVMHRQSLEHQHLPDIDPHDPHEPHAHLPAASGDSGAVALHTHADPHRHQSKKRGPSALGLIGPLGLIVHSTVDGLAIGLGFQAGADIGLIVALAVVAHDFADGMNVVTLAFAGGQADRAARLVLALDALAPVIGVVIGSVVAVSDRALGGLLAVFAGVFIAVGAGHLLPEAEHGRPGSAPLIVGLALAGAVVVVVVRSLAG